MGRFVFVLATLACLGAMDLLTPGLGACEGSQNRVAVRMDEQTFITVKDYDDAESVHLYRIQEGRIVLMDSVLVRQDPQVDRIVEWKRIPVKVGN